LRIINKDTSEGELLEMATTAFDKGWTSLKLYFMLGLPTETIDDIEGIIQLVDKVRSLGRKAKGKKPQIRVSLSTFVPKPHTPFQWVAQESETELAARCGLLRSGLPGKGVKLSWSEPKVSLLEAALSRGDRRLGRVIHRAWELGSTFDAWDECFKYENWARAFSEAGLTPGFYARRQRSLDEVMPWAHIDVGVTQAFLKQELERAMNGRLTTDCRYGNCNASGLERWQPSCQQKLTLKHSSRHQPR